MTQERQPRTSSSDFWNQIQARYRSARTRLRSRVPLVLRRSAAAGTGRGVRPQRPHSAVSHYHFALQVHLQALWPQTAVRTLHAPAAHAAAHRRSASLGPRAESGQTSSWAYRRVPIETEHCGAFRGPSVATLSARTLRVSGAFAPQSSGTAVTAASQPSSPLAWHAPTALGHSRSRERAGATAPASLATRAAWHEARTSAFAGTLVRQYLYDSPGVHRASGTSAPRAVSHETAPASHAAGAPPRAGGWRRPAQRSDAAETHAARVLAPSASPSQTVRPRDTRAASAAESIRVPLYTQPVARAFASQPTPAAAPPPTPAIQRAEPPSPVRAQQMQPQIDIGRLTEDVYQHMQRKIRIERERRGL